MAAESNLATPQTDWGRERRRARRIPLTVPVKVLYGSAPVEAQFGFTADVSAHGALLLLPQPIAAGTELQLRISLPRDLDNTRSPFMDMMARARVARLLPQHKGIGVGIEIHSMTPIGHA